jgi:hypothetical protein
MLPTLINERRMLETLKVVVDDKKKTNERNNKPLHNEFLGEKYFERKNPHSKASSLYSSTMNKGHNTLSEL